MPYKDIEQRRASKRRSNAKNLVPWREYRKQWMRDHRDRMAAAQKRYRLKNADKIKARSALNGAIRRGKLSRPSHCSLCGLERPVQGHHHMGYSVENRLEVIWLCRECHRATDRRY